MWDTLLRYLAGLINEISSLDTDLILLVTLIFVVFIVLDAVREFSRASHTAIGLSPQSTVVSIEGSKSLPQREYVSEIQGLAGRPDAVIVEDGHFIPIERKPLARRMHDRYVAQILIYMRLVEEFEGKKPPYGYLILGPKCRRFKILNSAERQAWAQKLIDEMRAILAGAKAQAAPHPKKCKRCSVREHCSSRADLEPAPELTDEQI